MKISPVNLKEERELNELLEGSTRIKVICGECIFALDIKQKTEQTEALDKNVTVVDELVDNLMGDVEELERILSWIDMLENKGKTVGDVSLRHRKRKLNVLKDNALKDLSLVGSFGLTVHSLILIADTSGKKVELSLIDHDEEADVLQVLYLLDRYNVGDSFYQALSAQCHSLPRPHKVKPARKQVNDTVELNRMIMTDCTDTTKSEISRIVSTRISINNKSTMAKL